MPVTIKELQDAIRQHIEAGLDAEEAIQRLATEFPDVKASDARIAVAAISEEYDHVLTDLDHDGQIAELAKDMIARAKRESGRSGMNTGEAIAYLAERGDQIARALLDDHYSPETQALQREIEAAVEWHPDWTKEPQEGHYSCRRGSAVDTTEKLLAAYRRASR